MPKARRCWVNALLNMFTLAVCGEATSITASGKETLSVLGPLPRDFDSALVMQEFRTALQIPSGKQGDMQQVEQKGSFSNLLAAKVYL